MSNQKKKIDNLKHDKKEKSSENMFMLITVLFLENVSSSSFPLL